LAKHSELLNIWRQCIAAAQTACVLAYPHAVPPESSSRFADIVILITIASTIVLCVIGFCIYSMCIPDRKAPQEPVIVLKEEVHVDRTSV
jgi:hypothetical protein